MTLFHPPMTLPVLPPSPSSVAEPPPSDFSGPPPPRAKITSVPTYIMSYPRQSGPVAAGTSPRAALTAWLMLCDHITRAGGHILVLDPPLGPPHGPSAPLGGIPEAAFLGALFSQPQTGQGAVFLQGRKNAPQDADPAPTAHIASLLSRAGLVCRQAEQPFAGQGDFFSLGRNRYLLAIGKDTPQSGAAEVRALLPIGARLLEVHLADAFPNGIRCLGHLSTLAGDAVLLVHPGGLRSQAIEEFSRFAANEIEIISISQEDALAFAPSALSVRGTLLLPTGLSSSLRGLLSRRGFSLVELDLSPLLPGGGGPRDLVNELPGYVLSEEAPSYTMRREELQRLVATYPETPPPV